MKISTAFSLGAALFAAFAFTQPAQAQAYRVIDIGALEDGLAARGYDINNLGQVVGWSQQSSHEGGILHRRAFVYDVTTGMRALGDDSWNQWMFDSYAGAINDAGDVAGGTGWGQLYPQARMQAFYVTGRGHMTVGIGAPDPISATGGGEGDGTTDLSVFTGMTEDGRVWGQTFLDQGDGGAAFYLTGAQGSGHQLSESPLHDGLASTINPLARTYDLGALNAARLLDHGLQFVSVVDINTRGQLLALGSNARTYVVSPVPEPETWAMLLGGLALVAQASRRRKALAA